MTPRIATGRVNCAANAQYTSTPALKQRRSPSCSSVALCYPGAYELPVSPSSIRSLLLVGPNGDNSPSARRTFFVLNANESPWGVTATSRPDPNVIVTSVVPSRGPGASDCPWNNVTHRRHFCRLPAHPELRPRRSRYDWGRKNKTRPCTEIPVYVSLQRVIKIDSQPYCNKICSQCVAFSKRLVRQTALSLIASAELMVTDAFACTTTTLQHL